jgi:hypothetical protein
MSEVTTVGKILLKHYSPANSHSFIESKDLDKKNIGAFFSNLAEHNEDSYKKVVSDLTRLGFESATRLGSTVRLGDLLPPSFKDERFKELNKEIKSIKDKKLPKKKEDDELTNLLNKFSDTANKEIIEEGLKDNKTLAKVVKAGARGSPEQYRQTIFSPVAVNDNKGGILTDFIIDRSFAEGLTLPQYLAHTFGARQASAATKLSVAEGGFLGKQLARANMTMVIEEHDCGTHNGIPVKTNDNDYIGSFLAHPIDKYHYNNEVTSSMLGILKSKGIEEIVVRNPITCEASHDGTSSALCQLCVGIRGKGLSELNSFIGVVAGTSAAEPVAQGALNCLAEGTLVRMADYSIKAIQDIKVGDMVLGSDNAGQTSPVKVLRLFNQGLQPVNKYRFRVGHTKQFTDLFATENHKILCNVKKWSCKAQRDNNVLQVLPLKHIGKDFSAIKAAAHISNLNESNDYAYLFGLLLGDGCCVKSVGTPHFSCADPTLIDAINNIYSKYGITAKLNTGQKIYYGIGLHKPCNINPVKTMLKKYDMWDKYAHEKTIPFEFYKWDNISISELIAGLIDTDGSICTSKIKNKERLLISFSSTSKEMISQIKDLLEWRFCVYPTNLTKVRITDMINSKHDQWAFTINDAQSLLNFKKYILVKGIKKQKLKDRMNMISDVQIAYTMKRQPKPEYLGLIQCWDIEVDSKDALFVLANGLIVHNSKHKGGSATGSNQFGGFKYINQLFNIPDSFVHEAPIADSDGKIEEVRVAPQGGHYIVIKHDNGKLEEYYVHPDLKVLVKSGQLVEEGDVLSDGIPNPAKITKHKGIGEGRRYFSKAIKDTFETSQLGGINKRNFDIISKGLITHVKITNPKGLGNNLPDSIVNYHTLEKAYSPRTNSKKVRTDMAQGLYLEIPELHYTIGTRITSTVINELKKHNIDYVTVNEAKPEFEPEMQRLLDVPAHEHDWMHTLYSTNLERRLIKAVNTGASSSLEGPSPIPGLAYAKGFGTHKFAEELEEQLSFE